jgi:hypothetical protein
VAGNRPFDEKRARIRAIADEAPQGAAAELRRFLADKSGYLVGEAAQAANRLGLSELTPDLGIAFARLLIDPVKVDKGCFGKNRIVEALLAFDAREPDVYLAGLRHFQPEPSFGPPVDAAAGLRGLCALALFHMDYPTALLDVTPLLADPEPVTRAAAADAIGSSGEEAGAAVLHIKALLGDREPDVVGACYRGLLRLLPARYLRFVAQRLTGGDEGEAEAAALALGESRLPGALPILKDAIEGLASGKLRDSALLGAALLRSDEANAYLVSLVEEGPEGQAIAALNALALHRHDAKLVERIQQAAAGRRSKKVAAALADKFGR